MTPHYTAKEMLTYTDTHNTVQPQEYESRIL